MPNKSQNIKCTYNTMSHNMINLLENCAHVNAEGYNPRNSTSIISQQE